MPRSLERSITVIVPALNEEENLEGAVAAVLSAVQGRFSHYEILIFDDGSTDRTGPIADALSSSHAKIRVIHNGQTRGPGYSYRKGVESASCEYVVPVHGDNEVPAESLARMFDHVGTADIVVPYFTNSWIRPRSRQLLSRVFRVLMVGLFGMRLRYLNGPSIHRSDLALLALPKTSGLSYLAVLLIRLVCSAYSVTEVGVELGGRTSGRSKAFRLKNLVSVGISLISLFLEIRVLRRRWRLPGAALPGDALSSRAAGGGDHA